VPSPFESAAILVGDQESLVGWVGEVHNHGRLAVASDSLSSIRSARRLLALQMAEKSSAWRPSPDKVHQISM
jgi:hypothetical protein